MPLLHEQVEERPVWKLVCDICQAESDYIETLEEAEEEDDWHISENPDWEEVELEGHTVLCDICHRLTPEDRGPLLFYDVRNAIIDHLRRLPGGQELDFRPGTPLWTVINALAMGGPQEALEARLLNLHQEDTRVIETAHAAIQSVRTTEVRVSSGFVGIESLATAPPSSPTTSVFFNIDTCDLPEWVYSGAWVRRLSDAARARVEVVDDVTVILTVNHDEMLHWRRGKDAAFDQEFEPLPPPPTRYERLRSDEVGVSLVAAVVGG